MKPSRVESVDHSTVTSVLLKGMWHQIVPGSFQVGTVEGVSSSFAFLDAHYNEWMLGPISSVDAVAIPNTVDPNAVDSGYSGSAV